MIENIKVGVRIHDFGKKDPFELAKLAKNIGFDGVQLVLNKALPNPLDNIFLLNQTNCEEIAHIFSNEGLDIMMLGSYFNPVHSNQELVKQMIDRFIEFEHKAKYFNCLYVGTETGSYNDDSWTYNPKNRTAEAFNTIKPIFKRLAIEAKKNNCYLAIEGAFGHCCYNPMVLNNLYNEIDNNHVRYIVDLYNYLSFDNYTEALSIFLDCLALFKNRIALFHLKDFIIENGTLKQVGLGKGIMPLKEMLTLIYYNEPTSYLIFEGVKPDEMESSMAYIKTLLSEIKTISLTPHDRSVLKELD